MTNPSPTVRRFPGTTTPIPPCGICGGPGPATADDSSHDDCYEMEGPTCSICDGLGHGYPGGPPCPLEVMDYSGEPWWAL